MPRRSGAPARPRGPVRSLRVRTAGLGDLPLLVEHRRRMWEDIGGRRRTDLDRADPAYRRWVRRELASHHFFAFVAERSNGRPAGSGALWLVPSQPRPGRLGRLRMPYVMSMYTDPAFRGRGVATRLVRRMVRWARDRGYARIFLHASTMGRPVYARFGFAPGNEMRLDLARRGRRGPGRPDPCER